MSEFHAILAVDGGDPDDDDNEPNNNEEHDADQEPKTTDADKALGRRTLTLQSAFRRLHVNLGHAPVPTMIRHLKHANALPEAIKAARDFHCPQCAAKGRPKDARQSAPTNVQPPLRHISMDVKEMPGWSAHDRIKTLNVVCETSGSHVVIPFGSGETETAKTLLEKSRSGWIHPYMRPR